MNPDHATRLLLVEDNSGDARLLREMLREEFSHNIEVAHVVTLHEAETHLALHGADIILLDLGLPDAQGVAAIQRAKLAAPHVPLVVLTGFDDEALATQALQGGAQDYLIKGQIDARGLLRALRYAVERNTMEEALFGEKERAEVTLGCIGEAVACTDISGNITFLNTVAETMTGWTLMEASGRPMAEVFRIAEHAGGEPFADEPLGSATNDRAHGPSNSTLVRRDGVETAIEASVAPIHDREGRATGAVMVFRDVSAARVMARQMSHSAQHDFLTGLPNRSLLNVRIEQAITVAKQNGSQVAVLFLDLDGFKHINDSLGHPIGDQLLRSIATRLIGCVRASDTVSRQGGDEFVVLLTDADRLDDALVVVRRMLKAVSEVHSIDQRDLHISTSIGVSLFPSDGVDAETLIKNADIAMYEAKEDGRDTFKVFKSEMNVRAVERQSVEESLRLALQREEFVLRYQPKVELRTGKITGAEALVRWAHPTRGLISPDEFIPIAEDCGLIRHIGKWVLREACGQARAWVDDGLPATRIAVNVSAKELQEEAFLGGVFAILDETGLNPKSLELELTESVLMKHSDSVATILQTLRENGIQVAVDDFGTGYSSLSYLRKFPIDVLKIDQSFVREIASAQDDTSIVSAVISMARTLRLRVVAEGVETLEQLAFLQAHQCEEAQGYLFSRPVEATAFGKLLQTGVLRPVAPVRRRARGVVRAA